MMMKGFYIVAFLLLSYPFFQVARCQLDSDEVEKSSIEETGFGIVREDVPDFDGGDLSSAPEVDTISIFPKNPSKLVIAGEETELVVGMKNDGESPIHIIAIKASLHLPYDHQYLVQNLSTQAFNNASVPPTAQAAFPYMFAVSKFLQPGTFDLDGIIIYEIDQNTYQSTFYNGTIEVTEASGFITIESVLLVSFGVALLGIFVLWIHSQIQNLSKKTKRAPKVEVGTKTIDSSMDEWLQGTAYSQSLSHKSKKQ